MPHFVSIAPEARQQLDAIVSDVNKARLGLQGHSALPHVHEAAKKSLKRAAHAAFALARAL